MKCHFCTVVRQRCYSMNEHITFQNLGQTICVIHWPWPDLTRPNLLTWRLDCNCGDVSGEQGRFNVVFDWLRKVPTAGGDSSTSTTSAHYIYNSYFFRGQRYWMYENRYNRTRFGDPLHVAEGWRGLPSTLDAYVQIIAPSAGEYTIDTYFFSGKYNVKGGA